MELGLITKQECDNQLKALEEALTKKVDYILKVRSDDLDIVLELPSEKLADNILIKSIIKDIYNYLKPINDLIAATIKADEEGVIDLKRLLNS